MTYYISPNLFFLLEKEGLLVWDYKNHTQYLLEKKYFSVLCDISQGVSIQDSSLPILKELEEAQLISTNHNSEAEEWGWDAISRIFHIGTQNVYSESPITDEQTLSQNYLNECERLSKETPQLFSEKEGPLINLPAPNLEVLDQASLLMALKRRKTCRHFFGRPITF